jgi:endoglucanase
VQIQNKYKILIALILMLKLDFTLGQNSSTNFFIIEKGIVRGDDRHRQIALVFTADEWFEGFTPILRRLEEHHVKAGFFLTGRLYRNTAAHHLIRKARKAGHYLGPHSDMHLLYNDWGRRDSLLVTRDSMQRDLQHNLQAMKALGIDHRRKLFIPPYEWWDQTVSGWCREMGWQVISFTPGTFTNADYTTPDMGTAYRSSDTLLQRLLRKESWEGLNGTILLIHIGTDPRRMDKLYDRLTELILALKDRGYRFVRIDRMIRK